jgi:hypothetical protein
MRGRLEEVAGLFKAQASPGANFGEEVYPGYPGVVVAEGAARTMTWGLSAAAQVDEADVQAQGREQRSG